MRSFLFTSQNSSLKNRTLEHERGGSVMIRIALIDVLDDPPYDITEIFRSVLTACGFSEDILVRIDGLAPKLYFPQDIELTGIIISGSIHHIYENRGKKWKNSLCDFIRRFYNQIPILGVCFGHQAIAYALDGRVIPNDKDKQIGSLPIYLTAEANKDLLFSQFKSGGLVPLSHLDHVSILPEKAVRLAYNEHSPNLAFRVGKSWGIQFHPELRPPLFKQLLSGRVKSLEKEDLSDEASTLQKVIESIKDCPEAIGVLKRFVQHCLKEHEKGERNETDF